jgi:hypothetical protein
VLNLKIEAIQMGRELKCGKTKTKRSTERLPTPKGCERGRLASEVKRREKCLPQAMASQAGGGATQQQHGESRVQGVVVVS